nr:hypothetical protein P413_12 [uncultured bacterium]
MFPMRRPVPKHRERIAAPVAQETMDAALAEFNRYKVRCNVTVDTPLGNGDYQHRS